MFTEMTFTTNHGTPRAARDFVRSALAAEHLDAVGVGEVSLLLTTELVTNAVQHARSAPTVRLLTVVDRLRVEVDDTSTTIPAVAMPDPARPSGYGLLLVASLASQWGADLRPGGKTVWFELPLPSLETSA